MLGDVTNFGRYVPANDGAREFQTYTLFYAQDSWRATQKLTAKLGVRSVALNISLKTVDFHRGGIAENSSICCKSQQCRNAGLTAGQGTQSAAKSAPIVFLRCPFKHLARGRTLRLIIGGDRRCTDASRQAILRAIARARLWYQQIVDGEVEWPAAHVTDVACLYRLALEKFTAGARYHAVAEEGVPLKEIATTIGRGLNVPVVSISPEQAHEHFGFLGFFAGRDAHISSAQTRVKLGWNPKGPDLLTDLGNMNYSQA